MARRILWSRVWVLSAVLGLGIFSGCAQENAAPAPAPETATGPASGDAPAADAPVGGRAADFGGGGEEARGGGRGGRGGR
ncbi:hypothetical protein [Tautonia rosea]|uniref:hypothetical protein n=1 Tax=Tautonia rosea TaxID=2728037 RepID=UPI0014762797|nr:hypothetical protein [Tautonia rosea]